MLVRTMWKSQFILFSIEDRSRPAREQAAATASGPALRLDPADGQQDPEQDRLGPWGTARHVDVHRQDLIDASRAGVAGRGDAARAGARADGDDHARLRDRLESAAYRRLEVARDGPGHD